MRRVIVGVLLAVSLTSCGSTSTGTSSDDDGGGSGIVYTYKNGQMKPGYDFGNGFVMPYDGSGMQPGFGY
jgi:hypothetical protein